MIGLIRRALVERVGRRNAGFGGRSGEHEGRRILLPADCVQQTRETGDVRVVVGLRVLFRDRDAGLRRQVKDGARAVKRVAERDGVAGVPLDPTKRDRRPWCAPRQHANSPTPESCGNRREAM